MQITWYKMGRHESLIETFVRDMRNFLTNAKRRDLLLPMERLLHSDVNN